MREKENLNQHENYSENEERNDFPAGETCQIVPEEKERETNCRDNSGQCRSGNFEFQIRAEDSTQQQQRRERSDPKCDLLEAGRFDSGYVVLEFGFLGQIGNRISDAFCEQRFVVDPFSCFLSIQSKDRALGMNDAIADFHFLVSIHERLCDVGVVPILNRGTTDQRRPI